MTNTFHDIKALLGYFSGAGSFDNFDWFNRNRNFLVDGVSVGRRSFNHGDLRILMLVITLSFDDAVHDNSQDKEHPEENSDSAA